MKWKILTNATRRTNLCTGVCSARTFYPILGITLTFKMRILRVLRDEIKVGENLCSCVLKLFCDRAQRRGDITASTSNQQFQNSNPQMAFVRSQHLFTVGQTETYFSSLFPPHTSYSASPAFTLQVQTLVASSAGIKICLHIDMGQQHYLNIFKRMSQNQKHNQFQATKRKILPRMLINKYYYYTVCLQS